MGGTEAEALDEALAAPVGEALVTGEEDLADLVGRVALAKEVVRSIHDIDDPDLAVTFVARHRTPVLHTGTAPGQTASHVDSARGDRYTSSVRR